MRSKLLLPRSPWLNLERIIFLIWAFAIVTALGTEISGTVCAGDSNNGEAGVEVTLRKSGGTGPNVRPPQYTSADGAYSFKSLAPGKYRLEFNKVGRSIVVPYKDPVALSSTSAPQKPMRAYVKGGTIDAARVAAFLWERSEGDSKSFAADIQALRQLAASDSRFAPTLELLSNPLGRTVGTIASVKPESKTVLIVPAGGSKPLKYHFNDSTVVLDLNQTIRADQLSKNAPDRAATILYKKDAQGRKVASRIYLEANPTVFNYKPGPDPQ